MTHPWLIAGVLAVLEEGAAFAAPQTRLCQPCGWEGCQVPNWPNAVCNGGVCRPACAGGQKFSCPLDGRPRCGSWAPRHCAHPERCP